jgi:uncharacterized membrane protein
MKPLIVLIAAFLIILLVQRIIKKQWRVNFAGRLAMSVMLFFTASGHFMFAEGMAMMLPDFIPFKQSVIYITGFIEIAAAIGLLLPKLQRPTARLLILFFISILPSNIYAAYRHIDIESADYTGSGPEYLWFRVPLQLFFIFWTWHFGLKTSQNKGNPYLSQTA